PTSCAVSTTTLISQTFPTMRSRRSTNGPPTNSPTSTTSPTCHSARSTNMSKTISVFEHERLSLGDVRETVDGGHVCFDQSTFDALVRHNDRHGGRYLRVGHKHLRFRQYVGFLQIGALGIEILPKA